MAGHGFWDDLASGFDPTKWGQSGGGFGQFGQDLSHSTNDVGKTLGLWGNQVNPSLANINTSQSDQDRAQQQLLIQQLQAQANGQGPSLAQQQLQNATNANMQQAMALGQSMPGGYGNNLAQQRNIMNAQAQAQQEAAGQSSMLRNMEQMQARQQLAGLEGGVRGQDFGAAQAQTANNMALQGMNNQISSADAGNWWKLLSGLGQAGMGVAGAGNGVGAGAGAANGANIGQATSGGGLGFGLNYGSAPTFAYGGRVGIGGSGIDRMSGHGSTGTMSAGGVVPGYAFGGDDPSNDTVPAWLSPKEIVLPRSVTLSDDAPEKAAAFVRAIKRKRAA